MNVVVQIWFILLCAMSNGNHVRLSYYPRESRRYASGGLCNSNVSVRLFVGLSVTRRYCVKTKKASVMSWFLYHLVAPRSYFSDAKFYPDVLRGSPRASASNKGGVGKISSFVTCESIICYSAYMLSPVRPSVCPSVRRVDHRKTVEVGIMKFSPYGSPIPLVSAG